jgi:hypothetical protein
LAFLRANIPRGTQVRVGQYVGRPITQKEAKSSDSGYLMAFKARPHWMSSKACDHFKFRNGRHMTVVWCGMVHDCSR